MALVLTTLQNGILSLTDADNPQFVGFPSSVAQAAQNWAGVINDYAQLVTPPSATASAAEQALVGVLAAASGQDAWLAAFPAALTAYAAALGGGMAPAYVATPPPVPIQLDPAIQLGANGAEAAVVAPILATIIDLWFKTGIAVSVPAGVSSSWA